MCFKKRGPKALTPAEAKKIALGGRSRQEVIAASERTDFLSRLVEYDRGTEETSPAAKVMIGQFLEAFGHNSSVMTKPSFCGEYRPLLTAFAANGVLLEEAIAGFWNRPELIFMACYCAASPTPPAHYWQRLHESVPRSSTTKDLRNYLLAQAKDSTAALSYAA